MRSGLIDSFELLLALKDGGHPVDQIQREGGEEGHIDGIAEENCLDRLEHGYECELEVLSDVGGGVNCYRSQQLHSNNTSNT